MLKSFRILAVALLSISGAHAGAETALDVEVSGRTPPSPQSIVDAYLEPPNHHRGMYRALMPSLASAVGANGRPRPRYVDGAARRAPAFIARDRSTR